MGAAAEQITPREAEHAEAIMQAARYKREHRREFVDKDLWYDWQHEAFAAREPETMVLAGNQTGKTWSSTYHDALDLTQRYPEWWTGFRFDHPIKALAVGVDSRQLQILQTNLFGEEVDRHFGGGWVHRDEISHRGIKWSSEPGIARRVPVLGKHGLSDIQLRSYTQTKTGQATLSFAGAIMDLIHPDEQPPDPLVGQFQARLVNGNMGRGGRLRYTMTPELGKTAEVARFMDTESDYHRLIGPIHWDQCGHISGEVRERMLAAIPENERDMRMGGQPYMAEGLIYPVADERIKVDPFQPQPWHRALKAIDIGYKNAGICWMLFDPEHGTRIVYRTELIQEAAVGLHVSALRQLWPEVPTVVPPDINNTEKGSGTMVRQLYQDAGLGAMIDFVNPDGSRYVEPGLLDIRTAMREGSFKAVSEGNQPFFREKAMYHRKEGKVVKVNDHVMDATRYVGMMVKTHGVPIGDLRNRRLPKQQTLSRRRANGRF